ncbi:helix-turn-helix domain-containing protein [uncultured Erythrobacter sp.]|uniref:helix-turn-helix domain-containing protein n=1 Tax=uncultured Erythrobacter sp. TaxID=263913 RepID=UPI00261FFB79|nr:helix-turn-helix domain-containing protein [uncultured Erythrobacter sp.]
MLFLDAFVRFGGVALLLMIAVTSWKHRKTWPSAPYLILSCGSVGALFLGYAPPALQPPEPLLSLARFADIPHLVFVWLFALSLYESEFRLRAWHVAVGVLYAAPIFWPRLAGVGLVADPPAWLPIYGGITSILLMGHLAWVTLHGRSDDLLERRRNSRTYFVVLLFLVTIAAAASEMVPDGAPIHFRTAKIMAIMPALVFGAIWMLRFNLPSAALTGSSGLPGDLQPQDKALLGKMQKHLLSDEGFRNPALTIVSLSAELGVSQHRLRALINQSLRQTNFSSFINRIRIDAVCDAMEQPETADLPILTLAFDAGFTSLSSFNKAFKSQQGMTPRAYRARLLAGGANARNPSPFSTNPQDAATART